MADETSDRSPLGVHGPRIGKYVSWGCLIVASIGFLVAALTFGRPISGFASVLVWGGLTGLWAFYERRSKLTWFLTALSGCMFLLQIVLLGTRR